MIKKANAIWHGNGLEGHGMMSTESDLLNDVKYTSKSRFEGAPGGSPEELIAAAHSACFSMQLKTKLFALENCIKFRRNRLLYWPKRQG